MKERADKCLPSLLTRRLLKTRGENVKKKQERTKSTINSYLFLVPATVIYLSVIVVPVFYSFFISLFKWNGIGEKSFVGLKNYINLFSGDDIFKISFFNNLKWIALTLVVTMTVALIFALMLNQKFAGRTFFRGLFYFPCVVSPIAVALIWRWIYNPNIGFINQFFKVLEIPFSQSWISMPDTSLYAIFAAALWQAVGQPMILFLAGLQGISADILEAARIDGANGIKRFFYVILPLLKNTFVIVIATLTVSAMKVYDVVQGLTGGGPNNATQMMSTYMYSQVFQYNNVGYGTAVACTMLLMMMLVIVPYVSFTAKEH